MVPGPARNRATKLYQDALFGVFGRQKAQIGRLEKIEQQNWILPL